MTLAVGLPSLLAAFGASVSTDIPRSRLGDFAIVIDRFQQHGGNAAVRTLHLAPPFYQSSRWKAQEVRDLVTQVLTPTVAPVGSTVPGATVPVPEGVPSLTQECGTSG